MGPIDKSQSDAFWLLFLHDFSLGLVGENRVSSSIPLFPHLFLLKYMQFFIIWWPHGRLLSEVGHVGPRVVFCLVGENRVSNSIPTPPHPPLQFLFKIYSKLFCMTWWAPWRPPCRGWPCRPRSIPPSAGRSPLYAPHWAQHTCRTDRILSENQGNAQQNLLEKRLNSQCADWLCGTQNWKSLNFFESAKICISHNF